MWHLCLLVIPHMIDTHNELDYCRLNMNLVTSDGVDEYTHELFEKYKLQWKLTYRHYKYKNNCIKIDLMNTQKKNHSE